MPLITKEKLKTFIAKILFESFVKENFEDVAAKITNTNIKTEGEKIAMRINKGMANYTLDMLPLPVVEYAVELLANAYAHGGEFTFPSGYKIEVNKKNIENGLVTIYFPNDSKAYRQFLGSNQWILDDEVALNKLSNYLMSNMKHKDAIEKFAQISGEEGVIPSKIKYLLTLYANNPGTVKSFHDFMKHGLGNAARGFRNNKKMASIDQSLNGEAGGTTFADMIRNDEDEPNGAESQYEKIPNNQSTSNTEYGAKMKSFAFSFLNALKKSGRLKAGNKIHESFESFIKLKAMVVADYPDKNTSAKRFSEMKQMFNSGRIEDDEIRKYMNYRQSHVEKNPDRNTYFKENARAVYNLALSNLPIAEEIAIKEGYPEGFANYLIENLFGMPIRANAYLMKIALTDTTKSPAEIMLHMKINRARLIKMFKKIRMDDAEFNEIINKVDTDILKRIIESENPLQVMKQYKISKKVLHQILLDNGKTEEEIANIFEFLMTKSKGQAVTNNEKEIGSDEFMNMSDLESLNEEDELLEESLENLETTFPSAEDTMWVLNHLK